jgi:hypothetical protein
VKEPNWKKCTEEEAWIYIATHLSKNGLSTVLVGGAVVSIYTEGAYRSGDLDFVLESFLTKNLSVLMAEIGFTDREGRHYRHPKCAHLSVEFSSPPVTIGDDGKIKPAIQKVDGYPIKMYTPTDCVRDRLASFIHFKARECLDQAVLVAKAHPVSLAKIRNWCRSERAEKEYDEFLRRLKE